MAKNDCLLLFEYLNKKFSKGLNILKISKRNINDSYYQTIYILEIKPSKGLIIKIPRNNFKEADFDFHDENNDHWMKIFGLISKI
jgi:hypothetical protein